MSVTDVKKTDERYKLMAEILMEISGGNKVSLMKETPTHFMAECWFCDDECQQQELGQFTVEKALLPPWSR
jgi:hypothetical protein